MKLFGLKFYHPNQETLSWKTVLLREVTQIIGLSLFVGVFGVLWIFFDKEERTIYDKISGIYVVKEKPVLKFVKEFRDYRKQHKENS